MKIYFNISDLEKHKFSKPEESVLVLMFSFKQGIWIKYKKRVVLNDMKYGKLIDVDTNSSYRGNYYDCYFRDKTILRVRFNPFSFWRNDSNYITKMTEYEYNKIKDLNE